MTRTRYHVTDQANLESVLADGLIPQVGARSIQCAEDSAIFLFTTREDAETAVGSWLGEQFDDDITLILLSVTLDENITEESTVEWEQVVRTTIPGSCISFLEILG